MKRIRHQKRVKGGRRSLATGVIQEIEDKVKQDMRTFKVSKSFVISTALAILYNVDVEKYFELDVKPKRRVRGKVIKFRRHA